jgi:hypothetical protein
MIPKMDIAARVILRVINDTLARQNYTAGLTVFTCPSGTQSRTPTSAAA